MPRMYLKRKPLTYARAWAQDTPVVYSFFQVKGFYMVKQI